MTRNEKFQKLWQLNEEWGLGIVFSSVDEKYGTKLYLSKDDPSQYYNYAFPLARNINEIDLAKVEEIFINDKKLPAFYLTEFEQKSGLLEGLVRRGYQLDSRDSWMRLDVDIYERRNPRSAIEEITLETYDEYLAIMLEVFSSFPGNENYFKICRKVLEKKIKNTFPDFTLEFYGIREGGRAVSGAGLFYSKSGNFACLHATGTLEAYRGKGYQTDLIQYRVSKASEMGISNIYSLAEHGEQSWKNLIKNGFEQVQVGYILTKPS